jgi:PadR family transcriptional regulator, regulatory protein PadR
VILTPGKLSSNPDCRFEAIIWSNEVEDRQRLSRLELLVLSATQRLGPGAFGTRIHRDVEQRIGRKVSLGSVYGALGRLEAKGLIRFRQGGPLSRTAGRSRRLAELTAVGWQALLQAREELARILGLVRNVISSANPAN